MQSCSWLSGSLCQSSLLGLCVGRVRLLYNPPVIHIVLATGGKWPKLHINKILYPVLKFNHADTAWSALRMFLGWVLNFVRSVADALAAMLWYHMACVNRCWVIQPRGYLCQNPADGWHRTAVPGPLHSHTETLYLAVWVPWALSQNLSLVFPLLVALPAVSCTACAGKLSPGCASQGRAGLG